MDYVVEAILLGVDALAFGISCNLYSSSKTAIKSMENIQVVEYNTKLVDQVASQPKKKLDYVVVRGTVKALSSPLRSFSTPRTFGVVQKLTTKEHLVTRHNFGFWGEHTRTIERIFNAVPFALRCGDIDIEVTEPLSATSLYLETISDVYEPSPGSVMDHIWGFFTGVRPIGFQKTEKMLREGVLLTGIGELSLSPDHCTLQLQPSKDGLPFFLTSLPLNTLSKRLEGEKQVYRDISVAFGLLGLALMGVMARRWWMKRLEKKREEERKLKLELHRKERRQRARTSDEQYSETQVCVVCRENPKEVILLPCGHVCICEDCSTDILNLCPICRAEIESRSPAYIA